MNLPTRKRWAIFSLTALIVVVTIVGWALHLAWTALEDIEGSGTTVNASVAEFKEQVDQDAKLLQDMQKQYSGVADHVTRALDRLNESPVDFAMGNNQQELTNFWAKSLDLKMWLRDQEASVNQGKLILNTPSGTFTANVKQSVLDIEHAYDAYLASVREFADAVATTNAPAERRRQFATVQSKFQRVLVLANQAEGQAAAIKLSQFYSKAWFPKSEEMLFSLIPELHRRLTKVHGQLILASVASAIGLLGGLVVVAYRVWISPLRIKLRESDAVIEGQKKLTHFGLLAADLAHEVRNPLAAINYRVFALQKVLAVGSAEHHDAEVIRAAIDRLDRIVKEFFELGRPATPNLVPVTAQTVFKEIHELLSPELEVNSIELKIEPSTDPLFRADPQQLRQVLINLIHNAAEAIGQKGTITLRARVSDMHLKGQRTDVVILEVQDNGPGISEEVRPKLFDPFFSTKERGTGLGLAIAARIADNHGGKLDLSTELGVGTTFRLVLPATGDV